MSRDEVAGNDILLEFLEVAFNHILYFRKLYPEEIFERKKIYATAVHISQHPELNEYLRNVLTAIQQLIAIDEKSIKSINLVICNNDGVPVEKYVFDLLELQTQISNEDPYFLKTEEALRTICLKLSILDAYLKPLPEDSTFSIEIQTYEAAHVALSENPKCENFPWIVDEDAKDIQNASLLPLKTIKTECLNLQMYVVEDKLAKE